MDKSATLSAEDNVQQTNYLIIDCGANLTNRKFAKDLDAVVNRAKDSGVIKMIVTAKSIVSSKDALRLSQLYPDSLYCTAGVHPHDAKLWNEDSEQIIRHIATNSECVAIGECGLDFNRDFSPRETQLEVFERQVQLACDLKANGMQKALFIHERDAHQPLIDVLSKYLQKLPTVVIHCFTGTKAEALKYIELGFYIALTGFLWKDKTDDGVRKLLEEKIIPINRLVIESDSPWCYPNTRASKLPQHVKQSLTERSLGFLHRYCTFQRNEPCSMPTTVEMIAACLEMSAEDVALKTTFNALKIFGLSG